MCSVFTMKKHYSANPLHAIAIDHSHFNSAVECHHFEDVAAIAGNRCIECGRYLMSVQGQTKVPYFFE